MSRTTLVLLCQLAVLHARNQIVYVENHHISSCQEVCESKSLMCDDDVMDMMDCATAAMSYCDNKELSSYNLQERESCRVRECLVNCGKAHYSAHGSTASRCTDVKTCSVYDASYQEICPCVMHISTYHNAMSNPWVAAGVFSLFASIFLLLAYKGFRILRKKWKDKKT